MTAIFRGWEDFNFSPIGGPSVSTTTTVFRIGYARCALVSTSSRFWRIPSSYGISVTGSWWFTARIVNSAPTGPTQEIAFLSAGDITRLALVGIGGGFFKLTKYDSAGNATDLINSTAPMAVQGDVGPTQKLDIFVNYSVGGNVQVYGDGDLLLSFLGDVTTEGITNITGIDLKSAFTDTFWSEIIWDTCDTRAWSLITQSPVANGNTDQWTGSVSDVNEITINDATNNATNTAGDIQEYTVNSLVTGDYAIVDYTVDSRSMAGLDGGPQNIELAVRTGSADFFSPTISLINALERTNYTWTINPNTSLNWTQTDLNDPNFNIGMKAIT